MTKAPSPTTHYTRLATESRQSYVGTVCLLMPSPLSWVSLWTAGADERRSPHSLLYRCRVALPLACGSNRNRSCTRTQTTPARQPPPLGDSGQDHGVAWCAQGLFQNANAAPPHIFLCFSLPPPQPSHPPHQQSNRYSPLDASPTLSHRPSRPYSHPRTHRKKDGALSPGVPPLGGQLQQ